MNDFLVLVCKTKIVGLVKEPACHAYILFGSVDKRLENAKYPVGVGPIPLKSWFTPSTLLTVLT
jgi:hypothetical protein